MRKHNPGVCGRCNKRADTRDSVMVCPACWAMREAAPTLLAACEKALLVHEDIGCSCLGCAALRTAIAEARGKP